MNSNIIIGIITVIISIVLGIAIFTNYWSVHSQKITVGNKTISTGSSAGLWQLCQNVGDSKNCVKYTESDKQSYFSQIFGVLGFALIVLGFIILIFNPKSYTFYSVIMIIGGLSSLLTAINWASDKTVNTNDTVFGYSWYMELIGSILSIILALYVKIKL